MAKSKECEKCGANLDFGEKCDCETAEKKKEDKKEKNKNK